MEEAKMNRRLKIHYESSTEGKSYCRVAEPAALTKDISLVTCKLCHRHTYTMRRFGNPEPPPHHPLYSEPPRDSLQFVHHEEPSGRALGVRELDNWILSYLKMVDATEPSQRYHLWVAITIVAAMLARKCSVKLGPEEYFPNLYTILIGPPGVRKGTAIRYGVDLLQDVDSAGAAMAPDAVTKEQLVMEMGMREEILFLDSGKQLQHSSLFVIAPELVVFIKENDHERLGYLCQLYDGLDKFEYKTKTSKNVYINKPGLWILGATTPNWIEIAMKQLGIGGGMTSRTIFVYSRTKGQHIPATKLKPFDPELRGKLVADLGTIKQLAGQFYFSQAADDEYSKWYEGKYRSTGVDDSRFASYWERLPSMVIKVAMVMCASRGDTMAIQAGDVVNSIRVFEKIHPDMPQSFGGLGQNIIGGQTEMVRVLLRERGTCTKQYIMSTLRHNINYWDYERIVRSLLAERFCSSHWDKDTGEQTLLCLEQRQEESLKIS